MMTKKGNKKVSKLLLLAFMSLVIIMPFIISCSMDSDQDAMHKDEIVTVKVPDKGETATINISEKAKEQMETPEIHTNKDNSQIFLVVEKMPKFLGGEKEMYKYIAENVNYPEEAKKEGVEGRVFLTFIIEKDGSVSEVELLRGIGSGCDEAAIEVVRNMPQWEPGKQHGQPVRVQYRMPIKFSLQ